MQEALFDNAPEPSPNGYRKGCGSTTGYRYGCRCAACCEAHTDYQRHWAESSGNVRPAEPSLEALPLE